MTTREKHLDPAKLITSYREGTLTRANVFAVLFSHADDPGWDLLADQLSEQDQVAFQQWMHEQLRCPGRHVGYTAIDHSKILSLISRFEQRGWPVPEREGLRARASRGVSFSAGDFFRLGFRVLLGVISIWFCHHLLTGRPWQIGDGEYRNSPALLHCSTYGILGCCLITCPFRKLLSAICLIGVVTLPLTYLAALGQWQSGNDGGGFYWLLIGGPACALGCIAYGGIAVTLLTNGSGENESRERSSDLMNYKDD